MNLKSGFASVFMFLLALPLRSAQPITVKGSDTMVILNQRWAEAYMAANPGVIVQVTGGGSGTGISALINGATDICAASRSMKDEEKAQLKTKYGTAGVETSVAKDGVAIYLNAANPLKELTLAQIKNIYMGKTTNWKELGGEDARIILYSRENNSGTYVFFKEHVLGGKDFSPMTQSLPGTAAVVNAVARDKKGIGYGGSARKTSNIKYCAVKADAEAPAFYPDKEHVVSGKYAASRHLFFYTREKPAGDVKKFIDWILSPAGQKIVDEAGYFPIK